MDMRVGGIVSGMDLEGMVQKLMDAERVPLTKLQQEQTNLTWKRDAFRDINSHLLELDNMMLEMKLSKTYKPKVAVSSQSGAVTATADAGAANGSYRFNVEQLATNEMNISKNPIEMDTTFEKGKHSIITFDEDGEPREHTFNIEEGDSLPQVLEKISKASEGRVNAFYDNTAKKVVLETTRTGNYNKNGPEIDFGWDAFFTSEDGLNLELNKKAQNAKFTYNDGLTIEPRDNQYSLNGINFEFNNVTEGNARITVSSDIDAAYDNIRAFVDKYNETIDVMNESQKEEKFRDFQPLTDEQKVEMSEKEIEQWEEKAKSGILKGESSIRDGMYTLRQGLQAYVDTGGEYNLLSQVGITTTKNYLDGGKLVIDDTNLKDALRENPDDVFKLFSSSVEVENRGLIHRFDDALDKTRGQIEQKAGKSTHTLDNYSIGKHIKEVNERISVFEKRMVQVEQRYWNQFTAMEKAISRLNQQSDYLFSQFGDAGM